MLLRSGIYELLSLNVKRSFESYRLGRIPIIQQTMLNPKCAYSVEFISLTIYLTLSSLLPIRMNRSLLRLIYALVGVSAEEVALGLREILREVRRAI